MEFKVGEVVVYPHHGAARIADIEQREMRGETLDYLVLQILHSDLEVRVPVKNSELVGVRARTRRAKHEAVRLRLLPRLEYGRGHPFGSETAACTCGAPPSTTKRFGG